MRAALALVTSLLMLAPIVGPAQTITVADRERAAIQNRLGWEQMKAERWPEAAKFFRQAIDIDPVFKYAYYGLGRANLAMKKYVEAIGVLEKCRNLYQAEGSRQFANAQEAQRFRQDRLLELDEQIRLQQGSTRRGPQRTEETMRQLQTMRRNLQEGIQRGNNMEIDSSVPPWVSLSLGSAYFRSGKLLDAEREYKATIAADSKSGEAHNNLAVVFLETGRYDEADASVKAAKKAGFTVHPQLEQDIKDKKRGSF